MPVEKPIFLLLLFSCSLGTHRWKTWWLHIPHGPMFQCWAAPHSLSLKWGILWNSAPLPGSKLQTPADDWNLHKHNCSFQPDDKNIENAVFHSRYRTVPQQFAKFLVPEIASWYSCLKNGIIVQNSGCTCIMLCVHSLCPCFDLAFQYKLLSVRLDWHNQPGDGWSCWFLAWPERLLLAYSSLRPL